MPRLVASDIAKALRKRIASGEWEESGRMPPERMLADEFCVARNTVRRAVGLLEEEGIVARHVGRGTFLRVPDPDVISAAVARMQETSPAALMDIRKLVEPAAAAFAATNASVSALNSAQEAHRMAVDSTDLAVFEHWDAEFHHRIFICSQNDFLKELHNIMRVIRNQGPWIDMKLRSFSEERRTRYCAEHEAILSAIFARDPERAKEAMLAHLQTVERNLLNRP